MNDPAQGLLRCAVACRGLRVEKLGKSVEVLLGQDLEKFLNDHGALPHLAWRRQADSVQRWQLGGDDPLRMRVQEIEYPAPLVDRHWRFAQQEQLLAHLGGIVGARPAVSEGEPFQDRLEVAIQMLLPGNADFIGHGHEAE